MAIEEQTIIDQITVTEGNYVLVRTATRLIKTEMVEADTFGKPKEDPPKMIEKKTVLSETYHRESLAPGQDVSDQPERVRAVCAAAWA